MKKKDVCLFMLYAVAFMAIFLFETIAAAQEFPRIKMLSQPFCPACVDVENVLEALRNEYVVNIEDFNVKEDMSQAEKYGIKKTPFLIFYDREGKEFATYSGVATGEEILGFFIDNDTPLLKK